MAKLIGTFNHPRYGMYYLFFDGSCYGISRKEDSVHCGYASISELLKVKGL